MVGAVPYGSTGGEDSGEGNGGKPCGSKGGYRPGKQARREVWCAINPELQGLPSGEGGFRPIGSRTGTRNEAVGGIGSQINEGGTVAEGRTRMGCPAGT